VAHGYDQNLINDTKKDMNNKEMIRDANEKHDAETIARKIESRASAAETSKNQGVGFAGFISAAQTAQLNLQLAAAGQGGGDGGTVGGGGMDQLESVQERMSGVGLGGHSLDV